MTKVVTALSKPEPPDDLWSQLDAAIVAIKPIRPEGSFTRAEFQHHQGDIPPRKANKILQSLVKADKVRKIALGNKTYYQLVKS